MEALDYAGEYDKNLIIVVNDNDQSIAENHDGEVEGGYGQMISGFYGMSDMKVKNLGLSKYFHTDYNADELLAEHGISVEGIINIIEDL